MRKIIAIFCLGFFLQGYSQRDNKVLVTIDGKKTTVADFRKVYEKNLDAIDNEEAKDVAKNLELYINYKLKVKEAYDIKLDTLTSYQKEIESYRNQLSAPYLQDTVFINNLVDAAYYRTKNEVKAKHILIRTPKAPTPKDTLEAYNKIQKIRQRILNGEDFEKVAVEVSEDPSARDDDKRGRKGNKGNLGFFSAFKMVYPFEDAAYNTKIGEVSKPFRTRFGYHILKVDEVRPSRGEVEVAHVLISNSNKNAKKLINEIYNRLEKDEQFKALARKYSDDNGSKSKGGKLRKFGSGVMVKPFEDAAFSLEKEGDYTKPFKTRFGWHIVQLIKKHPVPAFEDLEREIRNKVKSGDRARLSQKAVTNKLKAKYNIQVNQPATAIFKDDKLREKSSEELTQNLLIINDKTYTQADFVDFIKNRRNKSIEDLFEDFKDQEVLNYYKDNLEKTEPDFAYTLQEYEDGLLLFELMQRKIWDKSSKDTLGLQSYFESNITNYKSKELKTIKGEVINDYQNFLEKQWVADLRRKSVIDVNKKELKKLTKYYDRRK